MKQNGKFIAVGYNIKSNEACANLDYKYGPYNSVREAFDALGEDGDDVIALGLTVGIVTEKGIEEYWWKDSLTLEGLVPKGTDLTPIYEIIEENEQVTAAALNDLDSRIKENDTTIVELLQEMNAKLDSINERISTQEQEQELDEWEEV